MIKSALHELWATRNGIVNCESTRKYFIFHSSTSQLTQTSRFFSTWKFNIFFIFTALPAHTCCMFDFLEITRMRMRKIPDLFLVFMCKREEIGKSEFCMEMSEHECGYVICSSIQFDADSDRIREVEKKEKKNYAALESSEGWELLKDLSTRLIITWRIFLYWIISFHLT